jgi:hypothetical protein
MEAACALSALTSSHDEGVCAAVKAAGGIPRLVGLLWGLGGSEGSSRRVDGSNGGVGDSSRNNSSIPAHCTNWRGNAARDVDDQLPAGNSDRDNSSSRVDGSSRNGSGIPEGCTNWRGNAACKQEDRTAGSDSRSDSAPNAAAAPDAGQCAALTAAAVTVLGSLAAGSAERRALIATMSGALPAIVACLSSPECCCRVAALQTLLHITAGDPWRLADGLVLAQVKAAGGCGPTQTALLHNLPQ